ncbi:HD-like signal output (HDOD) domain, no enzymatic activity [Alteromonadaceae bacterium Bs31]|nr:HD-like signal output (HDOD) domain, no enzymatic activity [Alteromonadaceae bacterium Bs31]
MPLPASIQEMLDSQKVSYNLSPKDGGLNSLSPVQLQKSGSIVQSVLLQDAQGRVQVLFPIGKIIDLESLRSQTGRKLEGVSMDDLKPLIRQQELVCVPAIPRWQGMQTIVDESLLDKKTLLLEPGSGGDLLEISQQDFTQIVATSDRARCAVDMPTLTEDDGDDEAKIFDSVKRFTQKRIKQRLDETLELPPLPETAQRIIKLRADPNADINDLANIVEIDPSLAAQVVSWAASPYYSAPGKIKSVHDAIVRVLGFDMVLNLSLGLALGKTMTMQCLTPRHVSRYWRGAVYTAAVVEGLVTSIAREHRPGFGMAYLSGLLNNFGYLVMAEVFPPYFSSIERLGKANPQAPSAAIEQHILGITGNQMASWLMDNWNMPEEVVVALRQQNNPKFDGVNAEYAKLVYIAQAMLANAGFGSGSPRQIPDSLFTELHLDAATAKITVDNILESGQDLDAIAEQMRG